MKKPLNWKPNPGHLPPGARGKRVVVRLLNGNECGHEPVTTVTPAGWSADTTNWTPDPQYSFSVTHYAVIE